MWICMALSRNSQITPAVVRARVHVWHLDLPSKEEAKEKRREASDIWPSRACSGCGIFGPWLWWCDIAMLTYQQTKKLHEKSADLPGA
jgi:hypothetical protein